MSYQLNSAKDAQGDEQVFMTKFNARRAEIEKYKQAHGGDLEGAYASVTGEQWPAGRSVKISHGQPEMTKDRTVKSVLGKYVAPIGAGALTALTLGGAAPALATMFGGGGAAAAPVAGSSITGGMSLMPAALPAVVGAGTSTAGAVAGGGALSTLAGLARKPNVLGGISKMITGGADASANNRGAALAANMDMDRLNIDRNAENRASTGDAWRRLQQAAYMEHRTPYAKPAGSTMDFSSMTHGASTPDELAGADAMKQEMLAQLKAGTSLPPATNVSQYTQPGAMERLARYAGPAANIFSSMRS